MKSKIYLTSLLALTLLISSCGSLSITQKRYSRGLNIDLFNAKEEKQADIKAKVATKKAPVNQDIKVETSTDVAVVPVSPAENKEMTAMVSEQPSKATTISARHHNPVSKFKAIKNIKKQFGEISNARNHNQAFQPSAKKSDADLELILLIICCFIPILSLVAIYIHDGGVTANFWIDLILYLTLVLWVVYALLVVLDILDFS